MNKRENNVNKSFEKKHCKKLSRRWFSDDVMLCDRLQGLSTEYKTKMGGIDSESFKVREKLKDLVGEQIRLADTESTAELKLRTQLGLKRRQSIIQVDDAISAADRFGVPVSNARRKSIQHAQGISSRKLSIASAGKDCPINKVPYTSGSSSSTSAMPIIANRSRRHSVHVSPFRTTKFERNRKGSNTTEFGSSLHTNEDVNFIEVPAVTMVQSLQEAETPPTTRRQRARSIKELKRDNITNRLDLTMSRRHSDERRDKPEDKQEDNQFTQLYEELANCRYLRMRGVDAKELTPAEIFAKDEN